MRVSKGSRVKLLVPKLWLRKLVRSLGDGVSLGQIFVHQRCGREEDCGTPALSCLTLSFLAREITNFVSLLTSAFLYPSQGPRAWGPQSGTDHPNHDCKQSRSV